MRKMEKIAGYLRREVREAYVMEACLRRHENLSCDGGLDRFFQIYLPSLTTKGYTAEDFRRVAHRIDEVVQQMMAEKAAQA